MNVVILAAGKGKRMNSVLPKVLQRLGNKPMLEWVLNSAEDLLKGQSPVVVIGHGAEQVEQYFADRPVKFVLQSEQKGTAHAVAQALPHLENEEPVLVLYGDVPLISPSTLEALSKQAGDEVGLLTVELENPTGYGRILRNEQGQVIGIVEEKDADDEQKKIKEVNTGIMIIPGKKIKGWLSQVGCNNKQNEYYLTDLIGFAAKEGVEIHTLKTADHWEVEGVNDKTQLQRLERALQRKQAAQLMSQGVCLADAERLDIRGSVKCGKDVFIDVGCVFEGEVVLEDNVRIGPYCVVKSTRIGAGTIVDAFSHFDNAVVGSSAKIGPFARLRPGAELSENVHVGNFVEIKKSIIGKSSKVNHLSYIGDCDMGANVNIGAGTITCNYDGVNKFRTVIEDDCFIGSDTQLVAPVTVHKHSTVGAGATVTRDVPEDSLFVRRAKPVTIPGWERPTKNKDLEIE